LAGVTKGQRTAGEISLSLKISQDLVERALGVFVVRRLVKVVPVDSTSSVTAYELVHDYVGELLLNGPSPILQRARDAQERLTFWESRTAGYWNYKDRSKVQRFLVFFEQPIPALEMLSIWKFATAQQQRLALVRNLRGFLLRTLAAATIFGACLSGLIAYRHSDSYVTRQVLETAPLDAAISDGRFQASGSITDWAIALASMGRFDQAKAAIDRLTDWNRSQALATLGATEKTLGLIEKASRVFDEAEKQADNITEGSWQQYAYELLAFKSASVSEYDRAKRIARKIKDRDAEARTLAILGQYLWRSHKTEEATAAWTEAADIAGAVDIETVADRIAYVGADDKARQLVQRYSRASSSEFACDLAKGMARDQRVNAALSEVQLDVRDPTTAARCDVEIAQIAFRSGKNDDARRVLGAAQTVLSSLEHPGEIGAKLINSAATVGSARDILLLEPQISALLIQLGDVEDGKTLLQKVLKDKSLREFDEEGGGLESSIAEALDCFYTLIDALARSGRYKEALEIINVQQDRRVRSKAEVILNGFRDDLDIKAALAKAKTVTDANVRSSILSELASNLAKHHKRPQAEVALAAARTAAGEIPIPRDRNRALTAVALNYIALGRLYDAYAISQLCSPSAEVEIFASIVRAHSNTTSKGADATKVIGVPDVEEIT
jgi:pentatricopeptide repeat protein